MKQKIIQLAKKFGYTVLFERPNSLIRFKRDEKMVDVWYSTMTVGVYENRTQTFYRKVEESNLAEYFC